MKTKFGKAQVYFIYFGIAFCVVSVLRVIFNF